MNSKIFHAAVFCPNPEGTLGLPFLLWGPPGSGKTSFVKAVERNYNMAYERLSPAERGEGQFGVCPVPMPDGTLHYPPPDWSKKFDGRAGLIFLDEINLAMPAIQAPLLGLVQLRTLGSHTFGPRTRIIAAANEVQDAAGGLGPRPGPRQPIRPLRLGGPERDGLDRGAHRWLHEQRRARGRRRG